MVFVNGGDDNNTNGQQRSGIYLLKTHILTATGLKRLPFLLTETDMACAQHTLALTMKIITMKVFFFCQTTYKYLNFFCSTTSSIHYYYCCVPRAHIFFLVISHHSSRSQCDRYLSWHGTHVEPITLQRAYLSPRSAVAENKRKLNKRSDTHARTHQTINLRTHSSHAFTTSNTSTTIESRIFTDKLHRYNSRWKQIQISMRCEQSIGATIQVIPLF